MIKDNKKIQSKFNYESSFQNALFLRLNELALRL